MRSGKRRFRFRFLAAVQEVDVVSKVVQRWCDGSSSSYDSLEYEEIPIEKEIPPAVISFTVDAYSPEEAQQKIQRYIAWNLKIQD